MNAGQHLAHYTIIRPLGKGGMGEVYLAEDKKLDRQVAIKVLPERLRQNPERLERFRREAKAAASLKHPNIATIHSLEEIEDQLLITMEYVEGESLRDRILSDGMDVDTFFDIFIPLAAALSHAHIQGRIHRDLKPGNIMIAEDGRPKILDFGLARIIDPDPVQVYSESEPTPEIGPDDETRTMNEEEQWKTTEAIEKGVPSLTRGGQLIGTPQYMSPEQAESEEIDFRTDIFSFGVVMYEALTGQRPFEGKTLESIIGRIVEAEPKAVTELKPVTPYTLWVLMRQCLKKNREQRIQTAGELHSALEDVQQEVKTGTVLVDASTIPEPISELAEPEPIPLWRQPVTIAVMVLMLIIGGGTIWMLKPIPAIPEPPLR
jgi:eukaryotic-like serine/threonine-protein kinase